MSTSPNHVASSERKPARLGASMSALAAAALKRPRPTVTGIGRAAAELARVVRGTSRVAPASGDRRFDDPAWRAEMGRRGRERVEQHLAWEHQQRGYLRVFDELAGRTTPADTLLADAGA